MSSESERDLRERNREFSAFWLALNALAESGIPLTTDQKMAALAVVQAVAKGRLTFTRSKHEALSEWEGDRNDPLFPEMKRQYSDDDRGDMMKLERETAQRIAASWEDIRRIEKEWRSELRTRNNTESQGEGIE